MTLNQTKRFIKEVLDNWFSNKDVLDKFSLKNGDLLFNNNSIGDMESFEEKDIADTIGFLWPSDFITNDNKQIETADGLIFITKGML